MRLFEKTYFLLKNIYTGSESFIIKKVANKGGVKVMWVVVLTACFGIIFLLDFFTPMSADDFGYMYIHATNTRVTNIFDIFQSQYNHYYLWGGRSVVHFIAQYLLLLPPTVVDLLNTLVYLLYVFLIYYLIKGRGKSCLSLFVLINFAIWLFQPAFADTILWITGSANYLWGTVIILLFLLPYRLYRDQKETSKISTVLKAILFLIFGVLAGWTNENTAFAMLLISLLFVCYYYSKGYKIPVWSITGIIGGFIGYYLMIQAPGNMVRAGDSAIIGFFIISYRFFNYTYTLITDYGFLLLFYLICLSIFLSFVKKQKREVFIFSSIFIVSALISIYVMLLSPAFPPRAWFGVLTFLIIGIGIVFYNLDYRYKFIFRIKASVLTIMFLAFLFSLVPISRDVYRFYQVYEERQLLVDKAKENGDTVCEFDRYIASTRFVHTEEVLSNHLLSLYYGIEIRFKKRSLE